MAKIMIVAGEPSGDLHASHVAAKISQFCTDVSLIGMGGDMMKDAGVELIYHIADSAVMGFTEILGAIPAFYRKLFHLRSIATEQKIDALLLVDFAEFNVRLAGSIHRNGIPTVYYIPPKAWAWRKYRARKVAKNVDVIASIFPFEAEFYRNAGANVEFVGHPLIDLIDCSVSRKEARREFDLGLNNCVIGLMPGSRRKEVERLLPVLIGTAHKIREIYPNSQFVLPLAQGIPEEAIPKLEFLRIVEQSDKWNNTLVYRCMRTCNLVIAASGTATLELACMSTPMIVIYKTSLPTWIMYKSLVNLSYCGLPNVIAQREIAPEILQNQLTIDRLTNETLKLLNNPQKLSTQKRELRQVVEQLGTKGAVENTARLVLETAGVIVSN